MFTGKSETIDGSVTYKEWRDGMSDEEKAAFELAQKKDSRRTADKARYAQYKSVLGAENVPKTLDEFQNVMYNGGEEWTELKRRYNYENKPYLQEQLVYTLPNGEKDFIPDKAVMSAVKTIAGAGSKTKLRVENKLVSEYGGEPGEWRKRVGKIESEKYIFDVHWYELNGRQYRMKLKNRSDKK